MYLLYRYFGLISILSILATSVVAEELSHNWLGEKDIPHFHMRTFPDIYHDEKEGFLYFSEEKLVNDSNQFGYNEINKLDKFLNSTLYNAMECNPAILKKNSEYIRYSYRLVILSLLYESIEESRRVMNQFNIKNSCHVNWKKFMAKKCRPHSTEMQHFVANTKLLWEMPVDGSKKKTGKEYNEIFSNKENMYFAMRRAKFNCGINCYLKTYHQLASRINKTCQEDLKLFSNICSEKDDLYGVSNTDIPYFLILNSNVINVFNSTGQAAGCLRQFAQMNEFKEIENELLRELLPLVFDLTVTKYDGAYDQGQIFFNGALKEFRQKGLDIVLTAVKKKKPKKKKVVVVEEDDEEEEDEEPEEIIIQVEKKKEIKKKLKKYVRRRPKPKKKVKIESAFVTAQNIYKKTNSKKVDLDMLKFKYDKVFSYKRIKDLESKLSSLMTVNALKDMKKFDALGAERSPVPLTFIKFLIDTNRHQNLYNLTGIVGKKFYVLNDLEKKPKKPVDFVLLINDISTNYRWQISIVEPEKKKK